MSICLKMYRTMCCALTDSNRVRVRVVARRFCVCVCGLVFMFVQMFFIKLMSFLFSPKITHSYIRIYIRTFAFSYTMYSRYFFLCIFFLCACQTIFQLDIFLYTQLNIAQRIPSRTHTQIIT